MTLSARSERALRYERTARSDDRDRVPVGACVEFSAACSCRRSTRLSAMGADEVITNQGVSSVIFAAGGASSGSTVVSVILGAAFLAGVVAVLVAKNRRR
ncbi:hypothetical protein [Streptomyces sp. enrichment culture]|uniref:hypothetical protein n=1 Tax=Streptomyces sp. enrichment culture TaxID=1795815 RepID=UPI003F5555EF